MLDEHTRECLAIVVARKIRSHDVLEVLADLFVRHGPPEYLRSDNGPEFTAKLVRRWLRWSYFVGQSEGDLKVDSDGLQSPRGPA